MDEDSEGNVTLTLLKVTPSDKGVYTVKATNSFGEAKCFAQLIVKEKPKLADSQDEVITKIEITRTEVEELPEEKVFIVETEKSKIEELPRVVKEEKIVEIEVKIKEEKKKDETSPPIFTKKFDNVTVHENEEVRLQCTVEGVPKPQVGTSPLSPTLTVLYE